ncbi:MAG: AAA family ATPase [Patescibacteria group bacterium]
MGNRSTHQKCVFLLVGQRGAGKSTYGARLVENQPGLSLVSRDEILTRRFGSTDLSPYGSGHYYASKVLSRFLRFKLSTGKGVKLVLDLWTGESDDRKYLVKMLREYGATRVVALYFTTPLSVVDSWFWQKPGIAKVEEMSARQGQKLTFFLPNAPARDYELFHQLAKDIDADGFDGVIRIDPREKPIVLV